MAPDKKDKKRKAATTVAADSPAKKTKKVEAKPSEAPKSILKKNKKDVPVAEDKATSKLKLNGGPARQVKPRKRAADFLSDDENEAEVTASEIKAEAEEKKQPSKKKSKKDDGTPVPAARAKTNGAAVKPKAKKPEPVVEESDEEEEDEVSVASDASSAGDDEALDDQTAALIRGFESSGDEDESGDEGFDPDQPVPKIPDSKKAKRKILKKQKKHDEPQEPGTVYVGRIPHGFYEHQMRAYFSQFGDITRLRLSRNRITGRSKHYAFVEFASSAVAKIVAETMDNYLMYGHILKCKFVPSDQLHPEVWKGANRRFKRTPWNRIEKKRLEKGKTREQWSDRIEREQKRRLSKAEKLKALGYEYEIPQLKSVDDVPVQEEAKAIEASETTTDEPVKVIEAPPTQATPAEKIDEAPKKSKKEKKGSQPAPKQETPKQEVAKSNGPATSLTKAGAKPKKTEKAKKKAKRV